jgi:hypothetical protein
MISKPPFVLSFVEGFREFQHAVNSNNLSLNGERVKP